MSLTFIRSDVLRAVQAQLIQTYGSLPGVRDENALESAVARPKQMQNYTGEEHIGVLAAWLAWAILRDRPFTDGNKRVALAALVMSAQLNEHRLTCGEVEETAMVLQAASSTISAEEWIAWAMHVVVPNEWIVSVQQDGKRNRPR